MSEIDRLVQDIEKLRKNLNDLIAEKNFNLQDPDIISASKELNDAITKYNNFLENKTNK